MQRALDQWHLRKVQARLDAARKAAPDLAPAELRALGDQARALRRRVDRMIQATDRQLGLATTSVGLPRPPVGADWSWRPDVWTTSLSAPGRVVTDKRTDISDGVALHHDCPLAEIAVRQLCNAHDVNRARFGLAVEVFGFNGSFLSLAVELPKAAVAGLKARHMIRLDTVIETDRPVKAFARLNVRHGPNTAQRVQELPANGQDKVVDFDLAYAKIAENRVESAWLDLIFNDAAFTRITLRDLVLFRCPRAET